jgi:hypothetical protein
MQGASSTVPFAAADGKCSPDDDSILRRDDTAAALVSLVHALASSVSAPCTPACSSESESLSKRPQNISSAQTVASSKSSDRVYGHNSFNGIKSLQNLPTDSCRARILSAARAVSDVLHLQYILALSRSAISDAIGVATGTWRAIAVFTTAPSDATQKRMREWVAQKLAENTSLKLPTPGPDGIPVPPSACADRGYWPHLNELIQLIDDIKASFLGFPDRSAAVESLMALTDISRRSVLNWFSLSTFPGRSHWYMLQQWCAICRSSGGLHALSAFEQRPRSVSLPNPHLMQGFNISRSEIQSPGKRAMPGGHNAIPPFKRPGTPVDPETSTPEFPDSCGREQSFIGTPQTAAKSESYKFTLPSPILAPKFGRSASGTPNLSHLSLKTPPFMPADSVGPAAALGLCNLFDLPQLPAAAELPQLPAELRLEFLKAVSHSLQTFSPMVHCDLDSMTQAIAVGFQRATLATLVSLSQNLGNQGQSSTSGYATEMTAPAADDSIESPTL